jgi:Ca2+-binding RTX toxin-like protein
VFEGIDGGADNDVLFGEGENDTLLGGNGSDELHGGTGEDVFNGGAGSDFMFGDAGNDIFQLGVGSGSDYVGDGSGVNRIVFGTGITLDSLRVSLGPLVQGKQIVVIEYGEGDSVTLGPSSASTMQFEFTSGPTLSYSALLSSLTSPISSVEDFPLIGTENSESSSPWAHCGLAPGW